MTVAHTDVGDIDLGWVRRTRTDGDSWSSIEVPLGEDMERYMVRVEVAGELLREETVNAPGWRYSVTQQLADGAGGAVTLSVAQISERFGTGPFSSIETTNA